MLNLFGAIYLASVLKRDNALMQTFHPLLAAAYFGNTDVIRMLISRIVLTKLLYIML